MSDTFAERYQRQRRWLTGVLAAAVLVVVSLPSYGQTRFHQYTKRYKSPPHPIREVSTAGYLGSGGAEWLAAGTFLADGTLVVAGTAFGPSMDRLGGATVRVVGEDGKAPAAVVAKQGKGGPVLAGWQHPNATGFVAALSSDLKSCRWATRFPWSSGSVTDVAADATGLYVIGQAGPQVARLGRVTDVSAEPKTDKPSVLVAKLAPNGSRLIWARTFTDVGQGPRLRLLDDGRIMAEGAWVYLFRPDGTLDEAVKVHKVNKWCRAVDPTGFTTVCGWDTNTHTGREPWRQPHLRVLPAPVGGEQPKGKEYYNWDSKRVGSKKYRLVSDSSIRRLFFADDGCLYAIGWSDGGNTVFERLPGDLDKAVPYKGLGFSTWGAGVGSFSHILKLDPRKPRIELLNKTLWASYLRGKDKPNSCWIDNLAVASDGSLLLTGTAAHHLIQTGDNLHYDPMDVAGPYVAVLKEDFSSIRFSTLLVATGKADRGRGANWGIAAGKVKGRHQVLFVSGAVAAQGGSDPARPAPSKAPIQKNYAGGLCDGYLILLDLGG